MSGSPILVCPWKENFLNGLVRHALARTNGNLGEACFIFPHSRPMRYVTDLLKKTPGIRRPLLMPQMYSVTDLFNRLAAGLDARPRWQAGTLDRVGLLLEVVRGLDLDGETLPSGDARYFYPWGLRLAALFEECLTQARAPANLPHLEEQAPPFAARLLGRLSAVFHGYLAGLEERGWTTPGLDAYRVARHLEQGGADLLGQGDGLGLGGLAVILAGFHALTGTEDRLFKHLWAERGAHVLVHADPALVRLGSGAGGKGGRGDEPHWSCGAFKAWAARWKTRLVLMQEAAKEAAQKGPDIRFCEGYDLHSQLEVMQRELDKANGEINTGETGDYAAHTAVVLPESGLLMPVMHHLPATDVNISMGYPLARSPLFRLLDTLLTLQENRRDSGYHWRDFVNLIRHPYIKMLSPADGGDLRRELHLLEQAARQGATVYVRPTALVEALSQGANQGRGQPPRPASLALIGRLFEACLESFENLSTPADLAKALEGVARILLEAGGDLWERFPIDAECLYRLLQSLIPELGRSALSVEVLSAPTLYALARQMMESERVPFEASPLVGMQVLGMLETRLLTFRKVIVIQATEDLLPGSPAPDPLLPESLRPALGLPELRVREQVAAYNFFRLLAGAEDVLLLWQEGGEAKGLEDKKKKKSRFIEELLWEYEQKTGQLFAHKEPRGPLSVLSCSIAALPQKRRIIPKTGLAALLMKRCLEGPISSTTLDNYLQCPARFFQNRLLSLGPADEPETGDDPRAIGNFLHTVLHDFYEKRLERDLPGGKEGPPEVIHSLEASFESHLDAAQLKQGMAADAYAMLQVAGRERLSRYLLNQPPTRVLGLEKKLGAVFPVLGRRFTLTGNLDRLDLRTQGPVIVDYKTGGTLPAVSTTVWEDAAFWNSLREWKPEPGDAPGPSPGGDPMLREVARRFGSVQLPFYILLYRLAYGEDAANALWVHLADNGQEKLLFDKKTDEGTLATAVASLIPELITFLLRHMESSPNFRPQPGPHCDWCSARASCMVTATRA